MRRLDLEASRGERGAVGRLLGGKENAPAAMAFLAMLSGLLCSSICFLAAYHSPSPAIWISAGTPFLTFAGSAVGYVFGRTASQ